jgi:hypothetical protein
MVTVEFRADIYGSNLLAGRTRSGKAEHQPAISVDALK